MRTVTIKDIPAGYVLRCNGCGETVEIAIILDSHSSDDSLVKLCKHCVAEAWDLLWRDR